ncbi:sigma-70 family RNA polymerase sigma factor [Nocardia australiensis]|uniref:sigma-70 family RNA polymerase sigma factor n=1 Tax=Nocardia australiensis TaxID=2887191 RepID=UPI001D1361F9|nr:sigma-70 family RNA polymerase sigma factor [Nocardia australiensis]
MRLPRPTRPRSDRAFLVALDADHGSAVRGYLHEHWRDQHQVEDLTQEVFIRAWRSAGILRRNGITDKEIRSWLLTTAHNVLVDRWRHEQRRPADPLEHDQLSAMALVEHPIDRAIDGWLVAEALQRLSAEHRGVVVQLYYRGRSIAEAAQHLGIAEGTVKSRSYYALRALRAIFDELGVTR